MRQREMSCRISLRVHSDLHSGNKHDNLLKKITYSLYLSLRSGIVQCEKIDNLLDGPSGNCGCLRSLADDPPATVAPRSLRQELPPHQLPIPSSVQPGNMKYLPSLLTKKDSSLSILWDSLNGN